MAKTPKITPKVNSKDYIRIVDVQTKQIAELNRNDFQDKLDEIISIAKKSFGKIDTVGNYKLKSFQISVGVGAGLIIVSLEGGITLNYEYHSNNIFSR